VVVLGDVFWTSYPHILSIWGRLNGTKILVRGNHDHFWLKKRPMEHHTIYEKSYKKKGGGRQTVVACHYPMRSWNKKAHGAIHVHGHSHNKIPPHWNMMDVGVDAAKVLTGTWRPLSLREIIYLTKGEENVY
jgi:calcineurin-like phosphoesterase family protein